jgi:hypothetical protein
MLIATLFALASAASSGTEGLRLQYSTRDAKEYIDITSVVTRAGLRQVRWVTDASGERRVDVYAFDCSRPRFAHVVTEKYRGSTRLESIVVPEDRWQAHLVAMPLKYPQTPIHRAREAGCAEPGKRK